MLQNLLVFKGCVEGHGEYYSFHVHITILGSDESALYQSPDYFKNELDCEEAMREELPLIACHVSRERPELMIDPSKYVDVDDKMPQQFTSKDLH